jgi:tail assembly chaperone
MREVQNHTVDNQTYRIQQLGAKQGRLVLGRLLRLAGPAAEADDPITKLLGALSDSEIDFLCDTFAKTTRVAGTNANGQEVELELSGIFDDHFAGRYGAMIKWLWACLQCNFGSFIEGLGISADKLQALAMAKSAKSMSGPTVVFGGPSPKASAG